MELEQLQNSEPPLASMYHVETITTSRITCALHAQPVILANMHQQNVLKMQTPFAPHVQHVFQGRFDWAALEILVEHAQSVNSNVQVGLSTSPLYALLQQTGSALHTRLVLQECI